MIYRYERIYNGGSLERVMSAVLYLRAAETGTIKRFDLWLGTPLSIGTSIFNLYVNGVAVWTGVNRPTISSTQQTVSKTGLAIAVTRGDIITLDLESIGQAPAPSPITMALEVDDGVSIYGKQTIWVPASSMTPATTNGPASAQLETTTNKQNYNVLDFDATTQENAHFQIAFPKSWNEGTISFIPVWSSTETDTDGVSWGLQAVAISDNEAIDAAWGTAQVVDDACQSAAGEVYVGAESSALTIAGSPAVGDLVFFRVFRDVADSNDTSNVDARLIGIKIIYTTDAATDD